eukprot:TRINITY_DN35316_c0_g1_i1.p1 TRINITY_DN35316_c0_g1~~TRINITY_DN35316_c0_g1_i1.p1  ORF type:complete len:390 (+),score=49.44 TRINITY_DN35316_c0_g1_i1:97-1266(+)
MSVAHFQRQLSKNSVRSEVNVEVSVTNLAGKEAARFTIERSATAGTLKYHVEQATGVPAAEQRLVQGCEHLDPERRMGMLPTDDRDTVHITLVRVAQRFAFTGSEDGSIRVWDLERCVCVQEVCCGCHVDCVAVDWPSRMAISGKSQILELWDLNRGSCVRRLSDTSPVRCVQLNWPKRLAVSGGARGILRLWNLENGQSVCELRGHERDVTSISTDWAGNGLLSGGVDGTLRLWNIVEGTNIWQSEIQGGSVRYVAVNWESRRALSADGGFGRIDTLRLWDLDARQCIRELPGSGDAHHVVTDSSMRVALACNRTGNFKLWDLQEGVCLRELMIEFAASIETIAMSWASKMALLGGPDGELQLVNLESGKCVSDCLGHSQRVSCLSMS